MYYSISILLPPFVSLLVAIISQTSKFGRRFSAIRDVWADPDLGWVRSLEIGIFATEFGSTNR